MSRLPASILAIALLMCSCNESTPAGDTGLYLPTAGSEAMMEALFRGPLVVRNECVLAGDPGDYILPIWQDGFTVERDDDGRVVVRDGVGTTVAIEGKVFEMGGGYIAEFEPEDKVDPRDAQIEQVVEMTGNTIPKRCLGSDVYGVWWVGDTEAISGS